MYNIIFPRLFSPLSGDDASHDEALASRIAALNMLDLGLEHLGVPIPSKKVKEDVKLVVKACGAGGFLHAILKERLFNYSCHIQSSSATGRSV